MPSNCGCRCRPRPSTVVGEVPCVYCLTPGSSFTLPRSLKMTYSGDVAIACGGSPVTVSSPCATWTATSLDCDEVLYGFFPPTRNKLSIVVVGEYVSLTCDFTYSVTVTRTNGGSPGVIYTYSVSGTPGTIPSSIGSVSIATATVVTTHHQPSTLTSGHYHTSVYTPYGDKDADLGTVSPSYFCGHGSSIYYGAGFPYLLIDWDTDDAMTTITKRVQYWVSYAPFTPADYDNTSTISFACYSP